MSLKYLIWLDYVKYWNYVFMLSLPFQNSNELVNFCCSLTQVLCFEIKINKNLPFVWKTILERTHSTRTSLPLTVLLV